MYIHCMCMHVHVHVGEPLVKEDEFFASETSRLSEGLRERVTLYEEEEHALRVMVREEVEERMLAGEGGRVCVCVCVLCVCARVFVRECVSLCVCVCERVCVCVCECVCVHVQCVYTCNIMCVHACMCIHVPIYYYVFTFVCVCSNWMLLLPCVSAESSATETQLGAVRESVTEEEEEGGGEREGAAETAVSPLKPYLDYYLQAENSVEALVNVR